MHARPAAELVKLASTFASDIKVSKDGVTVNAKSIMGVLMLAAERGSSLTFLARGEDAVEAVSRLVKLVAEGFGEAGEELQ
ncbi:MAG: HPr family phosphocarrier protein [Gemmatimonadetes bacterium]|nr:HPr family phosphocarrier protein [Gemmatimonadota bacterium]